MGQEERERVETEDKDAFNSFWILTHSQEIWSYRNTADQPEELWLQVGSGKLFYPFVNVFRGLLFLI